MSTFDHGFTSSPRLELLVRQLILLAGELRDCLAAGEWEDADAFQETYDAAFASFRHHVDAGHVIPPALANDVTRLARVHEENIRLTAQLRDSAGRERQNVRTISRIGAYAPRRVYAGSDDRSHFLDGSA